MKAVLITPIVLLFAVACGPSSEPVPALPAKPESAPQAAAEPTEPPRVVVYTSRQPHLIEPLFQRYTEQTGVAVEFINDNDGSLIERLDAEGASTEADVLMTVDVGTLWHAAERDLLRPVDSDVLNATVPESLRDEQGRWFGLSVRARTIVYHPERVAADALSSYEALADERWRGRLCLRTSRKVYNQSLVAMLLEHHGEQATEQMVSAWVANLATEPFSSDTRLIEAIAAGQCDVGLVNSYYLGRLLAEDPDYPVALFWANQDTSGVHVNISGGGVTRHAPRPEQARALLEWLVSDSVQVEFARLNLEFPVNPAIEPDGVVAQWGPFRRDETALSVAGRRQAEAVRLMDRAGYR
jgi:iron(III) transport system substrate-binding protein